MEFHKYIKAVGTGPKGNRDLDEDEIINAINMILDNEAKPSQVGAFLIAWRTKSETIPELKAMAKALTTRVKTSALENSMELGYSFDGRVNNPFLFPLYDDILKRYYQKNSDIERLNLVISMDELQPAKKGLVVKDLFDSLPTYEYVKIFNRKDYLEDLSNLTSLRHELGLRTAFNTVEKLLNPALSDYSITTAFHKPYVKKYIEIFKEFYKDVFVIKASEGSPEVFKDGKYWKSIDDEIVEFPFKLADFGINLPDEYEKITLEDNLNIIKKPDDKYLNLAKFNLAMFLFLTNRVSTLDESWARIQDI